MTDASNKGAEAYSPAHASPRAAKPPRVHDDDLRVCMDTVVISSSARNLVVRMASEQKRVEVAAQEGATSQPRPERRVFPLLRFPRTPSFAMFGFFLIRVEGAGLDFSLRLRLRSK
jgi:hypothetical protein